MTQYGIDNETCNLPKADNAIVNDFHNLGYKLGVGDEKTPLTWQEIESYSNMRHTKLSMWECEQIVLMSREYCEWLVKARDLSCVAPWHSEDYNAINATSKQVNTGFASLRAAAKNKNKSRN